MNIDTSPEALSFICVNMVLSLLTDHPIHPPNTVDPWECDLPEDCGYEIKCEKGVFQIYREAGNPDSKILYEHADLKKFVSDMHTLCALIADGPLKSFCYRRLSYLSSKFQLHVLLNELRELAAQKAVAHRDFYNVRKVGLQDQYFGIQMKMVYLTICRSILTSTRRRA